LRPGTTISNKIKFNFIMANFCFISSSILFAISNGPSWSYWSWIFNYLCNQCLSPLSLWIGIWLRQGVLDTTLYDKVSNLTFDPILLWEICSRNTNQRYYIHMPVCLKWEIKREFWCLTPLFGGGNQSTRRKPPSKILNIRYFRTNLSSFLFFLLVLYE
jgi:hypothetical protein